MVVRLAIPQIFAEKYWQSIIINYVDCVCIIRKGMSLVNMTVVIGFVQYKTDVGL